MINKKHYLNIFFISIFFLFGTLFYIVLKTKNSGYFGIIFENLLNPYFVIIKNILTLLITFLVTYFFIRITRKLLKKYLENNGRKKRNIKLFLTIYSYFVWIIVIFVTFSLLLKQVGSLITSIGLIGFGVTFALQKPLLNFVGWITIIFGRTYKIGDIISINNVTGQVYDIRVMYANVGELNSDGDSTGKSISIPNEFVFTSPVVNLTRGTNFIWEEIKIFFTYKSNEKKAIKIVEKTVQDYYNKHIKSDVKQTFKDDFKEHEKIILRFGLYDKGFFIKVHYLVDFNKSNEVKTELSKILLDKLKSKDIVLGKVESVA
ncbi:MAG: mechanosensitive ion channel domain-containing protein [Nanoarchaeota archaeon]